MKKTNFINAFILSFSLTSCGVVSQGRLQNVTITSNPPQATIFLDNYPCGQPPQIVSLRSKHPHTVIVCKEGYQTESYQLTPKCSSVLYGNFASIGQGLE